MSINADLLIDRLYLKGQITKWRILALIFALASLFILSEQIIPSKTLESDYIARISIEGVIGDDQKLYDLIFNLKDDKKAKAVIVRIDTPGGSAVGGEEIYLQLRKLSEIKPTVAVIRSIGTSAGYMAALGTDHIIARSGTITGSIGVMIETAEITSLAEKLGVKPISIKSSPLKASPSPFEKSTPEAEKVIKDMIMNFYNHFVDMVAERRNLTKEKALTLSDGRIYSGLQAAENGLIDEIGGEEEARNWLFKTHAIPDNLPVSDVEMENEEELLDRIINEISGKFWQKSAIPLDGIKALWHY